MEKQEIIDRLNCIYDYAIQVGCINKGSREYRPIIKREKMLLDDLRNLINEIEKEEK